MPGNSSAENPPSAANKIRSKESPHDRRSRRGKGKRQRRGQPPTKRAPKFTGKTEGLKAFLYDLGYSQADMYTETTRKIAEYCGREYKTVQMLKDQ